MIEHVYTVRMKQRVLLTKQDIATVKEFLERNDQKEYFVDVFKRLTCCPDKDEYIGCFNSKILST
jgi:hypothetical protein